MSTKFKTIDEYILVFPANIQSQLQTLREIIKSAAPNSFETISYNMPAFKQKINLAYFAAFKDHISLFPTSSPIKYFKKDLIKYKTSKGTIQFEFDKPLPAKLIKKIIKFRIKEVLEKK